MQQTSLKNFKMSYTVDIVFCIDATGSMGGLINMVKTNAITFYDDVMKEMQRKHKNVSNMRVRVIAFRDYVADGEEAMMVTDFFSLPQESTLLEKSVSSIVADGGGDEPEDGLEALGYAIRSKWNNEGMRKRQVIVVWTDASTHELGFGKGEPNYPRNMAQNFGELTSWWRNNAGENYIDQNAKRLILFAPEANYWTNISNSWDNVIYHPAKAGEGLKDKDYSEIIEVVANSI